MGKTDAACEESRHGFGGTITAVNLGTNLALTTTTGADGANYLARLPHGAYRLTVQAMGFRPYRREPITLNSGDKSRIDATLEVGETTEAITVTAELTGIETSWMAPLREPKVEPRTLPHPRR